MIIEPEQIVIDLSTPLSMRSSFRFPLQSETSRREMLWGAVLLVALPGIGWFLNLGHRVIVVHRMQHDQPPWPAWHNYGELFRHGVVTAGGMAYYYLPGFIVAYAAWSLVSLPLGLVAGALLLGATVAIPGYMSHYCREFDAAEIYNPFRTLRRCIQGGIAYWHAWLIALTALAISFAGLLALGVGFLVTSVWFWQVGFFVCERIHAAVRAWKRKVIGRSVGADPCTGVTASRDHPTRGQLNDPSLAARLNSILHLTNPAKFERSAISSIRG